MISFFKATGLDSVFPSNEVATNPKSLFELDEIEEKNRMKPVINTLVGLAGAQAFFGVGKIPGFPFGLLHNARGLPILGLRGGALLGYQGALLAGSFVSGVMMGSGLNYLPQFLGAKKTVGHHLGDAAIAVFGPCDRHGTFFKVGQFLGLA